MCLLSITLFICYQINLGKFYFFFFCTMVVVTIKEAQLVFVMDNLNFRIRNVAFEANVFDRYGTFDWIANRSMEDSCYAYLDCDLLDNATLTIITIKVKSFQIKMNEHHMQKCMFVKVNFLRIESKSKRGFEKDDMYVIIIELITIVS